MMQDDSLQVEPKYICGGNNSVMVVFAWSRLLFRMPYRADTSQGPGLLQWVRGQDTLQEA